MCWYGAVSRTAIQSQTSKTHGSNVWVTSAATECPLRMRSCATETCSVPAQVLVLAATLASVFPKSLLATVLRAQRASFVPFQTRGISDSGCSDMNSTRGSVVEGRAASTGGHTRQASLGQPGHAAAHGSEQQQTAASSHAQEDHPSVITESKPSVENDLLGIGAQFDAYPDGRRY